MGKYWITLVICIQLITQIINFVPTTMASGYGKDKYSILISSGLKWGQLKVHCKVNEFVLEPGKSFGWDFEVDIEWLGYYNYYSCNFDWNGKEVDLNAWNGEHGGTCAESKTHWAVLEDGFYFRCVGGKGNWEKWLTWEGRIHLGPSVDNAY
ncbi:hypothetical protein Cgig2_007905 [Carnegiea gigantea]|uniref:S-protein homolog n=1 Tax=Carnegiea gigantea TaxID=171969 RepID=A0A9Q1KFZ9_9CARY|nr:hypothetical protein Cgig2_007905 [Carnegiea gigantea]